MQFLDALAAVTPVAAVLRRLGVRYYICGSLASTFYGVSRTTADVDLVAELSPAHVAPLVESLQGNYYVDERMIRDAIARKSCFNVIHLPTSFKVDIFAVKNRPYDKKAMERIREEDIFDEEPPCQPFFISSLEDVILAKLEWYRLGDEISERQWSDIVGVMRVHRAALDRRYLEYWAGELGVADLLQKAWTEAEISCP
jgi:hypothetical protein